MKLRNTSSFLMLVPLLVACQSGGESAQQQEWQSLFDGESLDGWTVKINGHELGDNYADTFRVADGVIQVNYEDYNNFDERFGHLFYELPFSAYRLKFEYRFTEQWLEDAPSYTYKNSGVMFHSQAPDTILTNQDWPISVEYQILGFDREGNPRPTANMCAPGTDVIFEGERDERHCINSSSDAFAWNEWVEGEIVVDRQSVVTHKVNGETVLEYSQPQIETGEGVVNGYNPEEKVPGTPLNEGYIALQSEGQGVEFRNIKIQVMD